MRGLKLNRKVSLSLKLVASFTDAWIETIKSLTIKPKSYVASFTDAWIETESIIAIRESGRSHLLQMRGLKLDVEEIELPYPVASFTDAWIETC